MNGRTLRKVGNVLLLPPMRLEEDAVDLPQVDDAHAITDRLEEAGDAEVPGAAKDALAGADDEVERLGSKDAVGSGAMT